MTKALHRNIDFRTSWSVAMTLDTDYIEELQNRFCLKGT
jgi:hypothetical protein